MVLLNKLAKVYSDNSLRVEALKNINIELPEKGMVFVIGKSGSGKSTLLNLLGGLDLPTSGEIVVNGLHLGKQLPLQDYRSAFVGFVFQEFNLDKELNVLQNVLLADRIGRQNPDKEKALELLGTLGIDEKKSKKKITQLSGGEKQRVAIARALIKQPKIILADEPTGKLDEKNSIAVFDELKRLSQNMLVVVVTHSREFAETYGDRIIKLQDGQIVGDYERNQNYKSDIEIEENKIIVPLGKQISERDLEVLNANAGSLIDFSGEPTFIEVDATEKVSVTKAVIASNDVAHALEQRGLKLKDVFYLIAKRLYARKIKLISMITLCVLVFSMVMLSLTIMQYDSYQAAAHTFINNNEKEIVVFGDNNNFNNEQISQAEQSFDTNFMRFFEMKDIELPSMLVNETGVGNITGVWELEKEQLASLDFSFLHIPPTQNLLYIEGVYDDPIIASVFFTFVNSQEVVDAIRQDAELLKSVNSPADLAPLVRLAYETAEDESGDDLDIELETLLLFLSQMDEEFSETQKEEWDDARDLIFDIQALIAYVEEILGVPLELETQAPNYPQAMTTEALLFLMTTTTPTVSFASTFPEKGNTQDVVVTDFMAYMLMRELSKAVPQLGITVPNAGSEELKEFLDSGFEATFLHFFNTLNGVFSLAPINIVGILDTGFKDKYFNFLDLRAPLNFSMDYMKFIYAANYYYSSVFAASDFSEHALGIDKPSPTFIRVGLDSSNQAEVFAFFDFMRENGLYYTSLLANTTNIISNYITNMQAIFVPVAAIMIFIGATLVAIFVLTDISKRKKEIGTLKALGMKDSCVLKAYLIENSIVFALISLITSAVSVLFRQIANSVIVDAASRYANQNLISLVTVLYSVPWIFIFNVALIFIVGIAVTIYPVMKITRISAIDALRKD